MLPVVRDLKKGVENLPADVSVFVEAQHLRAIGAPVPTEKKWIESDPETGEGDFEFVEIPDSRPVEIKAGVLRNILNSL